MAGLLDPRFGDGSTMSSYTPTMRERATDWVRGLLYSDDREGQQRAERVMDVATFTPFGFGADMYDAGREAGLGNFGAAAGTLAMAGMPGPSPKRIRAYHGSPHDFDRFSMDKIGTGEGAQAYGHGLYFAEQEGIARSYRDGLSAAKRPVIPEDPALLEKIKNNNKRADYLSDQQQYASSQAEFDSIANKIAAIEDENKGLLGTKGSMYEVEINADPDSFLDWDKPLSEQPEAVRSALSSVMPDYRTRNIAGTPHAFVNDRMIELENPEISGRDAYVLSRMGQQGPTTREQAAVASNVLREAGIPGIKYLDAGSRGAGDGTRNYVVFDDSLIDIIRKYGLAGLLGGGTAAMQAMQDQPQEGYQ
ncbi:MAG: hypothetical protein RLZZ09_470 [Pseudomonadota bacterium]|jgi:hypothetical protein